MRTRLAVVASIALVLLVPASALAAPAARTYHGVFTAGAFHGCAGVPVDPLPIPAVWGNWNATLSPQGAEVHATVFADFGTGQVHVQSFGGVSMGATTLTATAPGEAFHVRIPADRVGGNQVDFVLSGDAYTFTISPYVIPPFFDCDSAVSSGTLR